MLSSRSSSQADVEKIPAGTDVQKAPLDDPDVEFGGQEARQQLEHKLVRKIDMRMSILTVIYILNYVRLRYLVTDHGNFTYISFPSRLIATMLRAALCALLTSFTDFLLQSGKSPRSGDRLEFA